MRTRKKRKIIVVRRTTPKVEPTNAVNVENHTSHTLPYTLTARQSITLATQVDEAEVDQKRKMESSTQNEQGTTHWKLPTF